MNVTHIGVPIVLIALLSITLISCGADCSQGNGKQNLKRQTELRENLDKLEQEWLKQCTAGMGSSEGDMPAQQEAFKQIVAMGPSIAPMIVERILRKPAAVAMTRKNFQFRPERLPWVWVLEEVTDHHLKDDAVYRELVSEHYRRSGSEELSRIGDPECQGYIPEIAIPHLLDWWDNTGVTEFGSTLVI
ncbi:MAG: hypothetical protein JWM11_7475 [Planctomycetaceae bacterium]|nr:hypothetical protein [Planctomycetaceae bacterium]